MSREVRKRKKRRRNPVFVLACAIFALVILSLILIIGHGHNRASEGEQTDLSETASAAEPEITCGVVPMQETQVEDKFFEDTAIMGNSLVDGLRLYGGLNTCDFYGSTSMSVTGAGELVNQMPKGAYEKVYILLGINEISLEVDYFIEKYGLLLDQIQERQPGADIYIMALTPVTEKKSAQGVFTRERVTQYNEALLDLAEQRGVWYVDLYETFADEMGYLPAEQSTDGVHLQAKAYETWANYLRTHYIPDSSEANE